MSHADEGQLHAYLDALERDPRRAAAWDGLEQHLEACGDCRDRLAEARSVRGRASAILHGSGPLDAAPPAFEELLARKRALSARRAVFRLNRLTAVGWAATVVMAVGVGWIARGSFEFAGRTGVGAPASETREVTGPAPQTAPSAFDDEPAGAMSARTTPGVEVERPALPAPEVEGGRVAQAPDAVITREAERNEPLAVQPAAPAPAAGAGDMGRVTAGARGAQPVKATDTVPRVSAEERLRQLRRGEVAPRAAMPEVAARDVTPEAVPEELAEGFAAQSWARGGEADLAIAWREIDLDEAEQTLGIAVALHPDLSVRAIETATVGNVPVIRVTYDLRDGDVAEVSQWRVGEGFGELDSREMDAITASTKLFRFSDAARVVALGVRRAEYQLHAVGREEEPVRALLQAIR